MTKVMRTDYVSSWDPAAVGSKPNYCQGPLGSPPPAAHWKLVDNIRS